MCVFWTAFKVECEQKNHFGYVQKAGKMIVHKMFDNGAKRLLLKLA